MARLDGEIGTRAREPKPRAAPHTVPGGHEGPAQSHHEPDSREQSPRTKRHNSAMSVPGLLLFIVFLGFFSYPLSRHRSRQASPPGWGWT